MIRIRFEPRDAWIGIYWTRDLLPAGFSNHPDRGSAVWSWRIYVCLLPCLPIVVSFERPAIAGAR